MATTVSFRNMHMSWLGVGCPCHWAFSCGFQSRRPSWHMRQCPSGWGKAPIHTVPSACLTFRILIQIARRSNFRKWICWSSHLTTLFWAMDEMKHFGITAATKMVFIKNSWTDKIREVLATIQCRFFSYLPSKRVKIRKVKLKLSLCLSKYHTVKTYPVLNLSTTSWRRIGGMEV